MYYTFSLFGTVSNPCELNNGGCSHLCLLSSTSDSRYSCACNDNVVLSSDGRTCIGNNNIGHYYEMVFA